MKNLIKKSLLAMAISATAVSAQADDLFDIKPGKMYIGPNVGLNLGFSSLDGTPFSLGVHGGMELNKNLAAELAYMGIFGADSNNGNYKTESSYNFFSGFGVYKMDVPEAPIYVKGKLGLTFASYEWKFKSKVYDNTSSTSVSGLFVGYGMGVGYDLTPNIAVEAEVSNSGSYGYGLILGGHMKF